MKQLPLLVVVGAVLHAQPTPDYSSTIEPIIRENCVACHRSGGAGPFSLSTYDDVRKHARQIADVTRSRYMPPWLPSNAAGTFEDERRLSPQQIGTIADWLAAGCPKGFKEKSTSTKERSVAANAEKWQLGTPDMILQASKPFLLPADGPDVFWNFVFPNPEKRLRYIRALEIRPGKPRLLHHANLLLDRAGQSLHEPGASDTGFPGMEVQISRNPLDPESHFLFWKPGSQAYAELPGFAWTLAPGNVLVLNTHLQPSGKQEPVSPTVGLYLTDQPPREFPILVQLQNDSHLDIPAGVRDFVIEDRLTLPIACKVLAIYPHAHYLGTLLSGWAILPDGTRQDLILIPHWNLAQQAVYRYRAPVSLPAGTIVAMRFHFDNSVANPRNPHSPPRRVRAGNAADDEMGHLWLQLLPEGTGDHRRPIQQAVIRHAIERAPRDPVGYLNLGALLLSRLDAQSAISALRRAIQLGSNGPQAHDMLGAALQNTGQLRPAIGEFQKALAVDPHYASAQYNLAIALVRAGRSHDALPYLQAVAAAYPGDERLQAEYKALRTSVGTVTDAQPR